MQVGGFDWDEANTDKCCKHGLTVSAIEAVFRGRPAVHPDPQHSNRETRFRAIGRTAEGRWAFVVFTWRQRDGLRLVRPISARYMHQKEVESYERQAEAPAGP